MDEEYSLYYDALFSQHSPSVEQAIFAKRTKLKPYIEEVDEEEESEVSGVGSSCHQCKSRRGLESLSFCHRMFLRGAMEHKDKKVKNLSTNFFLVELEFFLASTLQKEILRLVPQKVLRRIASKDSSQCFQRMELPRLQKCMLLCRL
jgi:hypothetical protein